MAQKLNVECSDEVAEFNGYNIGPGQQAPLLIAGKKFEMMTFGFTPSWSKKQMYMFNARSEGDHNKENSDAYTGNKGILQKPSFRSAIRKTRGLVFVNGFLEGPEKEKLSKPYLVYDESKPFFALAAIWNAWVNKDTGEEIKTFAVLTAAPNKVTKAIGHHRSPVIIDEAHYDTWINSEHLDEITPLMAPYQRDTLNAVPLSAEIKSPRVDDIDLLKPIGDPIIPRVGIEFQTEFDKQGFGRKKKL